MKDRRSYEPIKESKVRHTAMAHEVSIKNIIPVAKNEKELNKWIKRANKRISSDDINPWS